MIFGAKTTVVALVEDKKNPNVKGTIKPVEVIIPRQYYNELDRDRIGRRQKTSKSYKKEDVLGSYSSSNGKVSSNTLVLHR